MSSSTSRTSRTSGSTDASIQSLDAPSLETQKMFTVSRMRKRWEKTQKKWGPLMFAKENWEDEYNFQPGRYAGQPSARAVEK
ncbi:uncharacterized protein N7483_004470 [Penicillium malachiteum]|uniref:uncharacterized protein n=1 Tax=Penicillium malachiteum TaxID=1324776 RepID=UPI002546E6C1|nr:uncharacterized protein N7483_004470 [Penicillium malachiteum]KAJ5729962.1 hypothetical protein N7483_004470 [Penicillium malachiteum]